MPEPREIQHELKSHWLGGNLIIYPSNCLGTEYHVDKWNGNDNNTGLDWDNAFATVAKAITTVNALIDWGNYPKAIHVIWIAPGVYPEALTTPPFDCHMIGLGIRGTDQCAEIHPAAGSALAGTGLGLHLNNIRFEGEGAVPVIDFGIVNSTIIENCEIYNGGGSYACTHGISIENSDHLVIRNCTFGSGATSLTHGIYAAGGDNKFLHAADIDNNIINAGIGIYIQDTCTASNAIIRNNVIQATTLCIDDDSNNAVIVNNRLVSAGLAASAYDINVAKAAGNIVTGSNATINVPTIA